MNRNQASRRQISNPGQSVFPRSNRCPCLPTLTPPLRKRNDKETTVRLSPAAPVPADSVVANDEISIGNIAEACPTVGKDALVSEVEDVLVKSGSSGVVVLANSKPVGLVMKDRLYYQLGTHYGVSLYYRRPVEKVMDHAPLIVNAHLPLEAVSKLVMERSPATMYDYIIVVHNGTLLGTVSIYSLLKNLTDLQIRRAFSASPLTGLAGNLVIEEKLKNLLEQRNPYAVLYIDLDHFKAFNDYYGFEQGDRALKKTAAILSLCLAGLKGSEARNFLGHIGGDDFLIITQWETAEKLCKSIVKTFDSEIRPLYCDKDLEQGHIEVINRKGDLEKVPIMTISISVVTNHHRHFSNYLEIGEVAAELKKKAKKIPQSIWLIDSRSGQHKG